MQNISVSEACFISEMGERVCWKLAFVFDELMEKGEAIFLSVLANVTCSV